MRGRGTPRVGHTPATKIIDVHAARDETDAVNYDGVLIFTRNAKVQSKDPAQLAMT